MSTLSKLSEHLFAQLDRLGQDDLTPDEIDAEAKRAEAIVSVSDEIIDGAKTQIAAARLYSEHGKVVLPMLPQIGAPKKDDEPDQ